MNALAPRPAMLAPDLAALEGVLLLIEDGARASRDLDAAVFEALGWHVTRASVTDPRRSWTVLSPLSTVALPLPRASKRLDAARALLPVGWDWGVGERRGRAQAWCTSGHPQGHPDLLWFEAIAATPALALTKAALHGQRALLARRIGRPAEPRVGCECGWTGPLGALRARAGSTAMFCPDCDRPARRIA